eukprot:jgi/Mesvir1/23716/Mv18663-RA.1
MNIHPSIRVPRDPPVWKDQGPPCSSRTVDGFVRGSMVGFAWGGFMGSYDAAKAGHRGSRLAFQIAKAMGASSLNFGMFLGFYNCAYCVLEDVRQEKSWVNATIAGGLTGAIMALPSLHPSSVLMSAAATAAVTTMLESMRTPT